MTLLNDSRPDPKAATLLDEIHGALLRHDYPALAPLGQALAAELDHPSQPMDARAVRVIRAKASRNAATLKATSRGIKAALRRLTEVRQVARGMVTYDRSGRHETPDPAGPAAKPLGRF
jgi:hypothetical protein